MLTQLANLPRFQLLEGPTPIQRLPRLEQAGGPAIYVKRDDLMGVGGGNKLFKPEFLIGDALEKGCNTFITTGAQQSNYARLSAAAAARAGLACELFLTNTVPRVDDTYLHNGNILLDDLFGAAVHRVPRGGDAFSAAQRHAADIEKVGRKGCVIGSGGSLPSAASATLHSPLRPSDRSGSWGCGSQASSCRTEAPARAPAWLPAWLGWAPIRDGSFRSPS
ncbi:pyridoxal-phosphate dependent enzyme [Sphingomonas sp. PB2P19]|uniref:pyridoxal-phosphate dependent enzyme n=1 Tax=Sphingomonas rhamnosi TaxID=3096156 RepID=UPI003FA6B074